MKLNLSPWTVVAAIGLALAILSSGCTPAYGQEQDSVDLPEGYEVMRDSWIIPNPFQNVAEYRFWTPHKGMASVAVYDVLGRHVVTQSEGPFDKQFAAIHVQIPGHWGAGIYFFRLTSGPEQKTLIATRRR